MGDERDGNITTPELPGRGQAIEDAALLFAGSASGRFSPRVHAPVMLGETLTIGRDSDATATRLAAGRLSLPDTLLSRSHLRISRLADSYEVEDLGSMNGTYLNGRRLADRVRLSDGDVLFFGPYASVFRTLPAESRTAIDEDRADPFGPVPTTSPRLAPVLARLRRLAAAHEDVLLIGETGVGKEVYARAIHRASGRRGRFVAINCAALPSELTESELFGYVRGAHSTASQSKAGLVELADGGTLFLDEIGDTSPALQAKLFRFLQEREVLPLGATRARRIDVHVVAATSRLGATASHDGVRPELVARFGAGPIRIPPLRRRIEDLGLLIEYFLARTPATPRQIEPAAFRALCFHGWPGNVRELEKALREAAAMSGGLPIKLTDLPPTVLGPARLAAKPAEGEGGDDAAAEADGESLPKSSRKPHRPGPSRLELEDLLRRNQGNVSKVARALDRRWSVVWRWIVKYGLEPGRYRC
jgi:transcriptional regulator with PAS, ATPase and Fis domain